MEALLKKVYRKTPDALKHASVVSSFKTSWNLKKNSGKETRMLEIGPGPVRIEGFETYNIVDYENVDYVGDASGRLPFGPDTFDVIYASHILEHIPWYETHKTLEEWTRVLKPGGSLEVWVPNGLKICKAFVDAELQDDRSFEEDDWFRFNEGKDPCVWASGRVFTYGDGTGEVNHQNWHRALFSERRLIELFEGAGLNDVEIMDPSRVRGFDHKWINLGVCGTK